MEYIVLSFFSAIAIYVVLAKVLGLGGLVYWEVWIDVFFTIILPIMFLGTFSGMVLSIFAGLWLSVILRITALFVKPTPPKWVSWFHFGRKDARRIRRNR